MDLDSKVCTEGHPPFIPWNDNDSDLVIGRRFEKVAELMGDAPSLYLGNRTHTYRELQQSAERIAGYLHELDKAGRVVLYLTNSFHHFAAALGALKAGWIYIPMDPSYPSKRSSQILNDADPDLVLTDARNRNALLDLANGTNVDRIQLVDDIAADSTLPSMSIQTNPDTPALILYTSGSTGRPKGVLHTHRSIAHNCLRRSRVQQIIPSDRLTLLYSGSVMGGIYGIYGAFLNGATLCPYDIKQEGLGGFADWLRASRITVYHSVTTLFRQILGLLEAGNRFPDLRLIILGGEQVLGRDIERGRRSFTQAIEFYCGIGSTETGSIRHIPISADTPIDPGPVPLGYPMEGMEILLLDTDRNPNQSAKWGEIAVRSQYLANGYWRQPDLTRERFIRDPEGGPYPIYLTGDLGTIDSSGCLAGRGRADRQVKIRGFRVEPAEVDVAALKRPEIQESKTVALANAEGTDVLACFFVRRPLSGITHEVLGKHLRAELPAYMVPDHLVELEVFPRTPNGKIDVLALKVPESASARPQAQPETPTEQRLAKIWSTALGQSALSVDTGFFDQGGNSLTAVAVSAKIEKAFGRRLPISSLFEYPTIRSLAAWLDSSAKDLPWSCIVPVREQGSGWPIYLIGGMTGEVFFCRQLVKHLKTDRPIYALEPDTLSGGLTRHARIEDVAHHYAQAIRGHQPDGPHTLAGYSFGGTVAFELARQLDSAGHQVAQTIIFDSLAPRLPAAKPRETPAAATPDGTPPSPTSRARKKVSPRRFLTLRWWLKSKGEWRRAYWRLKYVKVYELLVRMNLSPPIAWRPYYAYWATHWMGQRYRARPHPGPTVLFRSEARRNQGDRGWRDLCGNTLRLIHIPGDHGSIFTEPHVKVLAHELDSILETDPSMG